MGENEKVENQVTIVDRFTNKVIGNFQQISKGVEMTTHQKNLIAGYFSAIDEALKNHKDNLTWKDVNLDKLSLSLANKAALGLDMQIKNTLFAIPYKNKDTGLVTVDLQIGYEGEKYLAMKFAKKKPKEIRVELVYEKDNFQIVKKDIHNICDGYILEVLSPFDRGKIIGGVGYIEYDDKTLNRVVTLSYDEIIKRKPEKTTKNFWSKWFDKMCEKTLMKHTCKYVELDAEKMRAYKRNLEFEETEDVESEKNDRIIEIDECLQTQETIDIDCGESYDN